MCIDIEDHFEPSAEVKAALEPFLGDCLSLSRRGKLVVRGRHAGRCTGRWRLRVERNVSALPSQSDWGPMARLLRVDLPGSGEVVEDFLVRVSDLGGLPGA